LPSFVFYNRLLLASAILGTIFSANAGPITILNNTMNLPEDISQAPVGFGSYSGYYFVDDSGTGADGPSTIWAVQSSGPNAGQASVFSSGGALSTSLTRGSAFLPSTFGSLGGDFVVAATNVSNCAQGTCGNTTGAYLLAFNASGQSTTLFSDTTAAQSRFPILGGPVIAPAGFGTYGGNLIVLDQPSANTQSYAGGAVLSIKPNGSATTVADLPVGQFTLSDAFTPAAFGQFGNMLLVGDLDSGSSSRWTHRVTPDCSRTFH
jgi:hypothetical protein